MIPWALDKDGNASTYNQLPNSQVDSKIDALQTKDTDHNNKKMLKTNQERQILSKSNIPEAENTLPIVHLSTEWYKASVGFLAGHREDGS